MDNKARCKSGAFGAQRNKTKTNQVTRKMACNMTVARNAQGKTKCSKRRKRVGHARRHALTKHKETHEKPTQSFFDRAAMSA